MTLKFGKCQGQKVKYQQKDHTCITSNIHVKYQCSRTNYSIFIYKVQVFKKVSKTQGHGHKVKRVDTHGKFLSHRVLM